tara:strand:- start:534 stop:1670 length:1137 start_codon:yes stop_codon:yes gene_type:complete
MKSLRKSFLILVIFPFFLGSCYLFFIASDRYVSGAGFAVRSMTNQGKGDLLTSVTGLASSGSSTSDSYIVNKFLESMDLFSSVNKKSDFLSIYSNPDIDFLSSLNPELSKEEKLKYWKRYIDSDFDPSSGIIRYEIQAFDPKSAHEIANLILQEVRNLINKLSEQARKDTMNYAKNELVHAQTNLMESREALRLFREETKSVDLSAIASSQVNLLTNLEKQLIDVKARISVLKKSLDLNAPSIKSLERKAEALISQISEKSGGLNITGYPRDLSVLLENQEVLQTKITFAESSYASAMASLESARIEASRNQRYLAIYSYPFIPEHPIYPQKLLWSTYLLLGLTLVWGICILLLLSIRDHISAAWIEGISSLPRNKLK